MPEKAILVTLASFLALLVAYRLYGRFLSTSIFRLRAERATPAHTMEDGVDYVPTRVPVLFGHHFASIAGLGPILGPAIAVIWGWLPAVLWVVAGSIFIGAVHDLGALTVSLRYKGRSIGDVTRELIGPRARLLFLLVIFFLMSLAMGAFVNAISKLFVYFNPDAIVPSFGLMLVAMAMGVSMYKLRTSLGPTTVVGLVAFAGLILWGVAQPVTSYNWFASPETRRAIEAEASAGALAAPFGGDQVIAHLNATGNSAAADDLTRAATEAQLAWIWMLLGYGFLASVLPVWLLLQPRDYVNSFQLYFAVAMMVVGLAVAGIVGSPHAQIDAPAVRTAADFATPEDAPPPLFPILFVTIACGAVSGFHSLVSSGTTVRQLNRETDATRIGFGAMLTEGALAVLVIMACAAGLGAAAWQSGGVYASWKGGIAGGGLAAQLDAVVQGGANFFSMVGIPVRYGTALLAVTIVAFAMTTLDSATRLLRFNVEEIFRSVQLPVLANRYVGSFVAVIGIAMFALVPAGKTLWILFGTTNQLLAGLTLLTVSIFLFKLRRPVWYTLLPMFAMLTITLLAMGYNVWDFVTAETKNWLLIGVSFAVIAMTVWLLVEAFLSFLRGPERLEGIEEEEAETVVPEFADALPTAD